MKLDFLASSFLDFIFPPVCVICGKIDKNWICENCNEKLEKYREKRVLTKIEDLKFVSRGKTVYKKPYFDEQYYIFSYKKLIRKLIIKFKFSDASYISHFFANEIFRDKKINDIFLSYDIMCLVPMDKKSKNLRGYNQTELMLRKFANCSKAINIEFDLLRKSRKTKTQSLLSGVDREENVKDAYEIEDAEKVRKKNIILFDDIYTTGATSNEISRLLKQNGAKKILIFTIAKD